MLVAYNQPEAGADRVSPKPPLILCSRLEVAVEPGIKRRQDCDVDAYSRNLASFPRLFHRPSVANVIDPLEGGNDLFVVGDDDDRGLILARHLVKDAHPVSRRRARLVAVEAAGSRPVTT